MNAYDDFDDATLENLAREARSGRTFTSEELAFTVHDAKEFRRLLKADAQQHLPLNWQAWADVPEPEMSPLHKVAVWVLLDTAAVLVSLVVGRIVWQGISAVVGS